MGLCLWKGWVRVSPGDVSPLKQSRFAQPKLSRQRGKGTVWLAGMRCFRGRSLRQLGREGCSGEGRGGTPVPVEAWPRQEGNSKAPALPGPGTRTGTAGRAGGVCRARGLRPSRSVLQSNSSRLNWELARSGKGQHLGLEELNQPNLGRTSTKLE